MSSPTRRTLVRLGLVAGVAAATCLVGTAPASAIPAGSPKIGMICDPGTVSGTTHTFNLVAEPGYISTPDGNAVYMWSYANADAPDSGHFQEPGPVLCVAQGETVVVHLSNSLPEATSIVFPGQDAQVTATGGAAGLLTTEAAAGTGSVTYSFVAGAPGTYLYESGSDVSKQIEMGLEGALVVRPSIGAAYAYDASTQFDPSREFLLLLSDIDPDLHHAVEVAYGASPPSPAPVYDINALRNRYFSINGREFPDTIQDNGSGLLPNQPYGALVRIQPNSATNPLPALIRMINVGALNHPFHPHGNHTRQIAQDGRPLRTPTNGDASTEHFGETIGSGQTQDFLLRWDQTDTFSPSNPQPVPPPNYLNVRFKDSNTWYSGSPYLGYKGTLPTGVVSQNACGEWYFPLHSHALNEFTNYDQGFGGMGTLLRVDPPAGCTAPAGSTAIVGGTLKSGSASALSGADTTFYQVNSKATAPGQATDWYAGFTGVPAAPTHFRVTYQGKNCDNTTGTACTAPATLPQQTVKVCDWTIAGATGCATATSSGWVALPTPPAQPQAVGGTEVTSTWNVAVPTTKYVGTGSYKGQVRVLVHTQRSTSVPFSTWGNLLTVAYDAP